MGRLRGLKGWVRRHSATAGAAVVTAVVLLLVFRGVLTPERAVGPITFAWMLALHALSQRLNTERHQRATLQGLIALQKAGVSYRLGRPGEAAQEVGQALKEIAAEECSGAPPQPTDATSAITKAV